MAIHALRTTSPTVLNDDESGLKLPAKQTQPFMDAYKRGVVATQEDYDGETVTTMYKALRLSSARVLFARVNNSTSVIILWTEQGLTMSVYFAVFALFYFVLGPAGLYDPNDEGQQVAILENFSQSLTSLAVFLLGLYTNISISRWWRMRTDGVGAISTASAHLALLVSQQVTRDSKVLSALRRYSRASLMLLFMQYRHQLDYPDLLVARKILTVDEVQGIKTLNRDCLQSLSETIWTWHACLLNSLHKEGVMPEGTLWRLLDCVKMGQKGAQLINDQLSTPLPYHYVHILGYMVKMHNAVLAVAMGAKAADLMLVNKSDSRFYMIFSCLKVFVPALMYNSVLLINAMLANPFALHALSFPQKKFDSALESEGLGYVEVAAHCPDWIHSPGASSPDGSFLSNRQVSPWQTATTPQQTALRQSKQKSKHQDIPQIPEFTKQSDSSPAKGDESAHAWGEEGEMTS